MQIELLGHKVKISHISSQLSDGIWHKENKLVVWIDCHDDPFQSVVGTAVTIPVKQYSKEELLEAVKHFGEPQLEEMEKRHIDEQEDMKNRRGRQARLDDMAKDLAKSVGLPN